jgi:hypothetical protein
MTVSKSLVVKTYQYSLKYRLISSIMSIVWVVLLIFIIYGGIRETYSHIAMSEIIQSSGFLWAGIMIIWFFILILSVFCLIALVGSLTMFPGIAVQPNGFRIHSRVGATRWLNWQAIYKTRRSPIGNFWFLGIKGLGPLYWPNGLFWWLGTGGIQISRHLNDYNELMSLLRKERPDIFVLSEE